MEPVGEKTTGTAGSAFDASGAIGKQFTSTPPPHRITISLLTVSSAEGALGGAAQAIGGPFDKEGAIGKNFTSGGSIGGSVQQHLGGQGENSSYSGNTK